MSVKHCLFLLELSLLRHVPNEDQPASLFIEENVALLDLNKALFDAALILGIGAWGVYVNRIDIILRVDRLQVIKLRLWLG